MRALRGSSRQHRNLVVALASFSVHSLIPGSIFHGQPSDLSIPSPLWSSKPDSFIRDFLLPSHAELTPSTTGQDQKNHVRCHLPIFGTFSDNQSVFFCVFPKQCSSISP